MGTLTRREFFGAARNTRTAGGSDLESVTGLRQAFLDRTLAEGSLLRLVGIGAAMEWWPLSVALPVRARLPS